MKGFCALKLEKIMLLYNLSMKDRRHLENTTVGTIGWKNVS